MCCEALRAACPGCRCPPPTAAPAAAALLPQLLRPPPCSPLTCLCTQHNPLPSPSAWMHCSRRPATSSLAAPHCTVRPPAGAVRRRPWRRGAAALEAALRQPDRGRPSKRRPAWPGARLPTPRFAPPHPAPTALPQPTRACPRKPLPPTCLWGRPQTRRAGALCCRWAAAVRLAALGGVGWQGAEHPAWLTMGAACLTSCSCCCREPTLRSCAHSSTHTRPRARQGAGYARRPFVPRPRRCSAACRRSWPSAGRPTRP